LILESVRNDDEICIGSKIVRKDLW